MHNTAPGGRALPKPIEDNQQLSGRCHYCGYSLKGLEKRGNCPECGTEYTEASASRLKPCPGILDTFKHHSLTLYLFILIYFFAVAGYLSTSYDRLTVLEVILILSAVPIYVYFQERARYKEYLPEQERKQLFTPVLLAIRTLIAAVVTLLFVVCAHFIIRWILD